MRPAVGAPLVYSAISQHKDSFVSFERFRSAVRIVRPYEAPEQEHREKRTAVNRFSDKSRRRLRFLVMNATPELVSQFCMTYHEQTYEAYRSAERCKADLNAFLVALRRHDRSIGYLWLLEFQSRGVVHFHLFLTVPPSPELHEFLADTWHRIAEPESPEHLAWHRHESNFIPWEMRSGSYVCKYLDKAAQKKVPEHFTWVGRFWGSSRGLVPPPDVITREKIDDNRQPFIDLETGEVIDDRVSGIVLRTLCKHHEARLRHSKWKKRARQSKMSHTLPVGALVIDKAITFAERSRPKAPRRQARERAGACR